MNNKNFGFVCEYSGNDRNGYNHTPYRVLAHTPKELFDFMANCHAYGASYGQGMEVSDRFRTSVNAHFGVEDGNWVMRKTMYYGVICDRPFFKDGSEIRSNDLRTTGCGAWGWSLIPARANTIEEHMAIVNAEREAEKAARIAAANEATARLRADYMIRRTGWYYVEFEVCYTTVENIGTNRQRHTSYSAHLLADSKMDAYEKASKDAMENYLPSQGLFPVWCGEWNGGMTDVQFLGMKTDDGYSVAAWEKYMNEQNNK